MQPFSGWDREAYFQNILPPLSVGGVHSKKKWVCSLEKKSSLWRTNTISIIMTPKAAVALLLFNVASTLVCHFCVVLREKEEKDWKKKSRLDVREGYKSSPIQGQYSQLFPEGK